VWLGDLLRALAALRPADEAGRRAVAEGLGFRVRGPDAEAPRRDTRPGRRRLRPQPAPAARSPLVPELEILEPIERASLAPVRIPSAQAVASLDDVHLEMLPPFMPLLRPAWAAGIVAAANETSVRDGPIDIDAMVERVSRLELVESVPQAPRASLHRGAQLLVDIGDGMQQFRRDQEELVELVTAIVGRNATEVLYFRDCPTREEGAGPGDAWTWTAYRLPEPRRPVLVLSDFGIAGAALRPAAPTVDEWVSLARRLALRESRLAAFVPFDSGRWPPALRAVAHLVPWDRSTGRGAVRDALGHAE
jgi:hypothetical protein